MFGYVYTFEGEGTRANDMGQSISALAGTAIAAGINERAGMHYQELTEPGNPRPMFAVLFAEVALRDVFENLFWPALRLCGLRLAAIRSLVANEINDARKPEFGYIDRERGYAIFIPSLPALVEDPPD